MAEAMKVPDGVIPLLREILDAFRYRHQRQAADAAGSLTFWRDGMLQYLEQIGRGEATGETLAKLKREYFDSEDPVQDAMAKLRRVRETLGANPLAEQIDKIMNEDGIGKSKIRREILYIINAWPAENLIEYAQGVCANIRRLNAELL